MKIQHASVVETDGVYRATVKVTSDLMSAEGTATAGNPQSAVVLAFTDAADQIASKARANLFIEFAVKF